MGEEARVLTRTLDDEEIIERVAALDIGKAELVCCLRVPDEDHRGRRLQEVQTYSTMTRSLLGMSDRLACLGVTRVVMEATSNTKPSSPGSAKRSRCQRSSSAISQVRISAGQSATGYG
jgi:hypothetical protein